jgi:hypothetical protein
MAMFETSAKGIPKIKQLVSQQKTIILSYYEENVTF